MIKYKADHVPLKTFFLGLKRRLRYSRALLPETDLYSKHKLMNTVLR